MHGMGTCALAHRVWDARAVESPKDDQLIWLLMAPKLMAPSEEQKGGGRHCPLGWGPWGRLGWKDGASGGRWRPQPLCLSPGAKALAETDDALGRVLGPREGPEPDQDSLFHAGPEEALEEVRPWARVLPSLQVLHGPEEDRDHIYHPREP